MYKPLMEASTHSLGIGAFEFDLHNLTLRWSFVLTNTKLTLIFD